ncbi:MAG TPA: response regulator [Myxococcaceae bacterium]|nr:response regulator [Myxococcaceae bacterium]
MSDIRALVVDDSQSMRRNLVYALRAIPGLTCEEAQDGVEGFKKFAAGSFQIVLTDINMPVMDGLKLISLVRKSPDRADVPIVVITTESAEQDREKAEALGASAYLVKPVQAIEVVDTVKSLLQLN